VLQVCLRCGASRWLSETNSPSAWRLPPASPPAPPSEQKISAQTVRVPPPAADKLQEIMDGLPTEVSLGHASFDKESLATVVVLEFSEKGFGFGEVTILQTPEGVFLDTENMGREKCLKYFSMLLDKAITDTNMAPARHALYSRATGRRCADGCPACAAAPKQEA